ncbi:glycosyltransferase family 2 protein [Enterococcus ratti]|uniref:Glycosyltransferase 2-like domain-containing protein n=1 Tax=Enterococcus ratti TaxID=150033 RepID=A0A1L8WII0_9ENTE|nr:glycosyltransferase family 2 protein [Enterococcus ratti]OJG80848.1 hypothetical protein RV14_GL000392 [Enterococcus ratti]
MISVIIPTFNAEKSIERAVNSVLSQSCQDFEIIIVDDCSTDNTWQILNRLQKKDHRIRIYQNDRNSKSAYTRNQAIKKARGEYIMQLDDDDYCRVDRMEKQLTFLQDHQAYSFVGSNAYLWDQAGIYGERIVKQQPEIKDLLKTSPFINPSVLFKKQVLESVGGYRVSKDTVRGQDYDLYMRLYAKGYKGYNLQEKLVYYYQDEAYYNKISWKNRLGESRLKYRNFKKLKVAKINYVYVLKPLVAIVIPKALFVWHKHRKKRSTFS